MQVEIIHDAPATLGEGPAWDVKTETLYWVDILGKRIHYHHRNDDGYIQLDEMPGCLAPTKIGTVLVAARVSILNLEPATARQTVLANVTEHTNNRFNDGKCDPVGRFLAGTMNMDESSPTGALYSFDGETVTQLLSSVTISNGLAWSPDYKTFYYIDTPTREVKAFDYDLITGQIANPRTAIIIPAALGWPDGMTSDIKGNLWIAMWGGGQITHWNPNTGQMVDYIHLPAKNITSCAFGGSDLNDLYITSARKGLNELELEKFRHSGHLMRIKTNVQGMPTFEFG